jgi:DNA invertase Pin-like site-specific DNA recombinase
VAIYARKSTESEDRQILSIDSQVAELRAYATRAGYSVAKVYTESMSAKAPGRPVFGELIRSIAPGQIEEVLCWKLDRLARNPVDGGTLIWAMEERKLRHIHTPQNSFSNTGTDKFWMQMEFGMAKKYVDDLSDNTKRGLRVKLEQGWRPGQTPLGYMNDTATKTIVRDPERFEIIRAMWDMMLTGLYTPKGIREKAVTDWGLRQRKTRSNRGGPISRATVYMMFTNPFYYGAIVYGGEYLEGAHEPMVSKDEFDKVQLLLNSRSRQRPQKLSFTYSGLMRCGECGAAITAENKCKTLKSTGEHKQYVYYHCTKRKPGITCSQRVIEEKELERQLAEFLESLTISKSYLSWTLSVLDGLGEDERRRDEKIITSLERRVEGCVRELSELLNLKLRGIIDDDEYLKKKSELQDESIGLKQRLNQMKTHEGSGLRRCREVYELAASARFSFENGTPDAKRAILASVCSNLVLLDRKLLISAHKPFQKIQDFLETPKGRKARFEPEILGLDNTRIAPIEDDSCAVLRVVNDVRTAVRSELAKDPLSSK